MKLTFPKFTFSLLLLCVAYVHAQVGIGTTTPDQSAMLQVAGANKGTLLSQVALTGIHDATTIANPAVGLLVYNKTAAAVATSSEIQVGYYYWNGTKWVNISEVTKSTGSNASVKTYAYIGPYSGQLSGLSVGDFSFRLFLSPNILNGITNGYVSPQIRNNTASSVNITGFAAMSYDNGDAAMNYTAGTLVNNATNLANPNTRALPSNS